MYTQCPQCHAIFAVTHEQIAARGGLVRCGQCASIFHADQYLFDTLPKDVGATELGLVIPDRRAKPRPETRPLDIPEQGSASRSAWRRVLWVLVNLTLFTVLAVQAAYFYRNELAQNSLLHPWVKSLCERIDCRLRPLQDISQIELLQAEVGPHPDYDRALQISASLTNHAPFVQPFPLMQVSLTDSNGVTLARRTFTPQQYLEEPKRAAQGMAPNVAISAVLDVTLPDERAVGYEIQLFEP